MSETKRRLFAWPHELEESGVLGINYRNLAFIQESNPRDSIRASTTKRSRRRSVMQTASRCPTRTPSFAATATSAGSWN